MNGSYEREAISRRYPNNEKLIQLYPSPEFLNSLSFIKKFYPLPFGAREKFIKVTHDNSCNLRHSEQLAKESSLLQYKAAAKNENNSTETDHASMPLDIFASKSVSCWHSNANLLAKSAFTLAEGATHVAHCDKYRRVAFTLAEVLITLGIIGVVAALTLPSIINNIKHKELETGFKKAYSTFSQGIMNMKREDGEGLAKYYAYYNPDTQTNPNAGEFFKKFYQYSGVKIIGKCNYKNITIKNYTKNAEAKSYCINNSGKVDGSCNYVDLADELSNGMCSALTITASTIFIIVDSNGMKGPNLLGHDIFFFKVDKNDNLIPIKMAKLYTDEELEDESMPTWSYVAGDPCSIKSKQAGNGTGCSYYALINQNPDDASKGYWESLP